MRPLHYLSIPLVALSCCLLGGAQQPSLPVASNDAAATFQREIRPLLAQYCVSCHSTEKHKGDLDLEAFSSLDAVKRQSKVWQSVAEQLAHNEMPPKDKPQPSAAEKERLAKWVAVTLGEIARANAGDPGPVVLRRLSNAEYTYTIRDLTGVDSLRPAREFPVDGAAGEGFTNTGQSLVMSPALLTKYLDAGKEIAAHAVLLPDGIRFSQHTTRRDWTEEVLQEVRGFYARFTDPREGGARVNLQGIVFDTNQGGRLPLEKYLDTLLQQRGAPADGRKTIEAIARERGLNARYLRSLQDVLTGQDPSHLLDGIRARWRAAGANDADVVMAEVEPWQKVLWKFNSVGHIGKVGGPKAWMEPVDPLVSSQELRLKMPPGTDGVVTLFLVATDAGDGSDGDIVLWRKPRLVAKGKPDLLLRDVRAAVRGLPGGGAPAGGAAAEEWGLDPAGFGARPGGGRIDPADLCVRANSVIEVRLPAQFAAGRELVVNGALDDTAGPQCSAQMQVLTESPERRSGLVAGVPVLVRDNSAPRARFAAAFDAFRRWFPPALCYAKIVPVDEVVTLTLFHREDEHLGRLMLDDAQKATLDRLWNTLRFVSQDALTLVDAFAQLLEYASQDADPKVFEPLRRPIHERAAAFRQRLLDAEPKHIDDVIDLAGRAYRRPLAAAEAEELRGLYRTLRKQGLAHEESIRLMIARVLVAPAFLYRPETPGPGDRQSPVTDLELTTRLSYFLWSSMPDPDLRAAASAGTLRDPDVLAAQARRMLGDERRVRRLATEFGCQWLHVHGFDELDEKSERHFPTFAKVRGDMYEESIRFFTDLFQHDRSILSILDADHMFLNGPLAAHYGIPGIAGDEWRRVDGVRKHGRGGVLGLGATLAKQSGASRTSPILRGNWVAEALLGDKLPRPPKDVPVLPEEEAAETLTVRQLTEKHSSDARCSGCHARIDPFGFALEGFDAIGRRRKRDLAGRPVDVRATALDGAQFEGIDGLREYLLTKRRDAFVRQFCRKLLGYALGRGVQLSDEPLLEEMKAKLEAKGHRVGVAIETIVQSRQFREIRGRERAED